MTWSSSHGNWINLTHGLLWDEDAITGDVPHGYSVQVTVDNVALTQRTPFATSGGDYDVDYKNGTVTFFASQSGKTVTATYSYARSSVYKLVPDPGKAIIVESAKVFWSEDMEMTDTVVNETYVGGGAQLVARTTYKRHRNFVEEAEEVGIALPAMGGPTRGIQSPMYSARFRYGGVAALTSALGIETHVSLENDTPFVGHWASVTFYCIVSDA